MRSCVRAGKIPGATDQNYTPSQNGSYTVRTTVAEGCFTESAPFDVIGVGISNINNEVSMTVFPNPMNEAAQINISANDASHLIISNVEGKIIMNIPVTSSHIILSKNDLSSGMYMVQLVNDKNEMISRLKLIVQ